MRSRLACLPALSLLALPVLAGCPDPHEVDAPYAIAASARVVVVAAQTDTVGGFGFGCGAPAGDGPSTTYVSSDGGARFVRHGADEAPGGARIVALQAHGARVYALRTTGSDFRLDATEDGEAWTTLATGSDLALALHVDDRRIAVAHATGVLISAGGGDFVDHPIAGAGLYQAALAAAGDHLVLATGDGALQASVDGDAWAPLPVAGLQQVHRLAGAGGRAIAISHVQAVAAAGGPWTSALVSVDPAAPGASTVAALDEGVLGVVATPAGLLVGDGTLASDPADPARRAAHTAAFRAGAADGARVALVGDGGVRISLDGGHTFGAEVVLPAPPAAP